MRSILLFALPIVLGACGSKHATGFDDGGNPDDDSGSIFDPDADLFGGDAGDGATACVPDPSNFDVPGNNCDDDGDGMVDNSASSCDNGSLMQTGDAYAFAKSIGLCPKSNGSSWGVVSAAYTQGYMNMQPPDMNQHGILTKFGNKLVPRDGK